jgi:hypothetical protein
MPLTALSSNPAKDFWNPSCEEAIYPGSLQKVGGSSQWPGRSRNNARRPPEVLISPLAMCESRHMTFTLQW